MHAHGDRAYVLLQAQLLGGKLHELVAPSILGEHLQARLTG
jgi:hypothetical protein